MQLIKIVEANPNTSVFAKWFSLDKEEFDFFLTMGSVLSKTSPLGNGIDSQNFNMKSGDILINEQNDKYFLIKFR